MFHHVYYSFLKVDSIIFRRKIIHRKVIIIMSIWHSHRSHVHIPYERNNRIAIKSIFYSQLQWVEQMLLPVWCFLHLARLPSHISSHAYLTSYFLIHLTYRSSRRNTIRFFVFDNLHAIDIRTKFFKLSNSCRRTRTRTRVHTHAHIHTTYTCSF